MSVPTEHCGIFAVHVVLHQHLGVYFKICQSLELLNRLKFDYFFKCPAKCSYLISNRCFLELVLKPNITAGLHLGNNLNHRKLANWQELWSNYNI